MPSSPLFWGLSTALFSAISFSPSALAAPQYAERGQTGTTSYSLDKEYSGSSFFTGFNFISTSDPTKGYVTYVNETVAQDAGLISFDGDYAVMSVDNHTVLDNWNKTSYYGINGIGRQSVRIESTYQFTHGLVIADIAQTPGGICGTWPSFWTYGSNWPYEGEIDIIEGANDQAGNWMTLHTGNSFSIANPFPGPAEASVSAHDCNYYSDSGINSVGCKFVDTDSTFGTSYPGGVWAMQWTSDVIKVWFWPYDSVPTDVAGGCPDPDSSEWGTPRANFIASQLSNPIDSIFRDHRLVFDTTFCGDFGDATWSSCAADLGASAYGSCAEYVAKTPTAFENAKWKINFFYDSDDDVITVSGCDPTGDPTGRANSPIGDPITVDPFVVDSLVDSFVKHLLDDPIEHIINSFQLHCIGIDDSIKPDFFIDQYDFFNGGNRQHCINLCGNHCGCHELC
ncbi:concanavalin A-like lectin/glucanase domain-containing protein [Xylariales sp. PMI_506]|nr:concanavalin A-like lectin/glucanase domain-containing protein [Xylariales sp. PMI_506]